MNIGAHIVREGCYFKVWTPNSKQVNVLSDIDNFKKGYKLSKIDNGYREGTLDGIHSGNQYKYVIVDDNNKKHFRIDPHLCTLNLDRKNPIDKAVYLCYINGMSNELCLKNPYEIMTGRRIVC